MVGCGAGRNITAQWKSILTGCEEPNQIPPPGKNEKNEEPLQVMDGQTLCGIKSLLMERKWFFFFIIVIIVSRSPSDTGVIKDIVIISFNLSIHIHHEIGGGGGREHVYEAQYAGAPLSVSLFPFSPSAKCILRQMTLISECYEADKGRNKAQTIRGETRVTYRWTSERGGPANIIRDLRGKKQTSVPLLWI